MQSQKLKDRILLNDQKLKMYLYNQANLNNSQNYNQKLNQKSFQNIEINQDISNLIYDKESSKLFKKNRIKLDQLNSFILSKNLGINNNINNINNNINNINKNANNNIDIKNKNKKNKNQFNLRLRTSHSALLTRTNSSPSFNITLSNKLGSINNYINAKNSRSRSVNFKKNTTNSKTTSATEENQKCFKKIEEKIKNLRNRSLPQKKIRKKINFNKTYDRFMEKEKKRNEKLEELKSLIKLVNKKIFTYKPEINKHNNSSENNFMERLEKNLEDRKKRNILLKERIIREETDNINANNFLLRKNKNKNKNKKIINVNEAIENLLDWEKQRKIRIEKEKQKLDDIINKTIQKVPKINKYKSHSFLKSNDVVYRLYDEYFLNKSKRMLKQQISMPNFSFKPEINEYKISKNKSQKQFKANRPNILCLIENKNEKEKNKEKGKEKKYVIKKDNESGEKTLKKNHSVNFIHVQRKQKNNL